jgi:hypothetical protein
MISRTVWSIAVVLLACCTAWADDIRRVVTGLDDNSQSIVLFDSRVAFAPGPFGIASTNMWITDSYPVGFPFKFKDDTATRPIGISPPANGTKFRIVEFPPLDPATEAKIDRYFLMKLVGD